MWLWHFVFVCFALPFWLYLFWLHRVHLTWIHKIGDIIIDKENLKQQKTKLKSNGTSPEFPCFVLFFSSVLISWFAQLCDCTDIRICEVFLRKMMGCQIKLRPWRWWAQCTLNKIQWVLYYLDQTLNIAFNNQIVKYPGSFVNSH